MKVENVVDRRFENGHNIYNVKIINKPDGKNRQKISEAIYRVV